MSLSALHAPTLPLQITKTHINKFIFLLKTPKLLRMSYIVPVTLFVNSPLCHHMGAFLFIYSGGRQYVPN